MGFVAAAAPFLAIGGAAISALSGVSSGIAASKQASYEAQVAANNATIARQNANYATAAGQQQSFIQGLRERQQAQGVTAGIAAGNINVNSGSAADVRISQAEIGQEDVETVRQRAALQAYGYRTQATSYQAESQLKTAEAGQDIQAGFLKGMGSLLTGASALGVGTSGSSGPSAATLNSLPDF